MAVHGVTDGSHADADASHWTSTEESSVDLGQLWQILRAHKQLGEGEEDTSATLELVVLQVWSCHFLF